MDNTLFSVQIASEIIAPQTGSLPFIHTAFIEESPYLYLFLRITKQWKNL